MKQNVTYCDICGDPTSTNESCISVVKDESTFENRSFQLNEDAEIVVAMFFSISNGEADLHIDCILDQIIKEEWTDAEEETARPTDTQGTIPTEIGG